MPTVELTERQRGLSNMLVESLRNVPATDEQRANAAFAASLLTDQQVRRMEGLIERLLWQESADFLLTEEQRRQIVEAVFEVFKGAVTVELTALGKPAAEVKHV